MTDGTSRRSRISPFRLHDRTEIIARCRWCGVQRNTLDEWRTSANCPNAPDSGPCMPSAIAAAERIHPHHSVVSLLRAAWNSIRSGDPPFVEPAAATLLAWLETTGQVEAARELSGLTVVRPYVPRPLSASDWSHFGNLAAAWQNRAVSTHGPSNVLLEAWKVAMGCPLCCGDPSLVGPAASTLLEWLDATGQDEAAVKLSGLTVFRPNEPKPPLFLMDDCVLLGELVEQRRNPYFPSLDYASADREDDMGWPGDDDERLDASLYRSTAPAGHDHGCPRCDGMQPSLAFSDDDFECSVCGRPFEG